MCNSIIKITGLYKSFDGKEVLSNLALDIRKKLITVVMGGNGEGKTTLINLILSLLCLDEGEIYIKDEKVNKSLTIEQKKRICFISDQPPFLEYLSGAENLKYVAHIYKKKIDNSGLAKMFKQYDLDPLNNTLVKDYSKGMRTKLSLCFIDVIDSEILILDEPTEGLDIISIEYLKNKILEFKEQGKSICIASHDTAFVSSIADEIYLINNKEATLLLDSNQKSLIRNINKLSELLIDNFKKK